MRLRSIDPAIVPVHVDATDLYEAEHPSLAEEAQRRQEIVFLALDLVSGRVDAAHPLRRGFSPTARARRSSNASSIARSTCRSSGSTSIRCSPTSASGATHPGASASSCLTPRVISSSPWGGSISSATACRFSSRRRPRSAQSSGGATGSISSVAATRQLRAEGVPLVGYTWWPMFALVAWAYRQGRREPHAYLAQMGLWDLDPSSATRLDSVPTQLVGALPELRRRRHCCGWPAGGRSRELLPVAAGKYQEYQPDVSQLLPCRFRRFDRVQPAWPMVRPRGRNRP